MWRRFAAVAVIFAAGCRSDAPAPRPATRPAVLADPLGEARERMVDTTIASRDITDKRVLDVMRLVPREEFMPPDEVDVAYDDSPQAIGFGLTISQPYIIAKMTEMAHVTPGSRVLEIGTGSGYQAAILAELGAKVYTIEINEDLAARTRGVLDDAGYGDVQLRAADGYYGWPEAGPFDAILVTCAAPSAPQPLIDQLAVGGRMVIPVGSDGGQMLEVLLKSPDGVSTDPLMEVNFGQMRGVVEEQSGGYAP